MRERLKRWIATVERWLPAPRFWSIEAEVRAVSLQRKLDLVDQLLAESERKIEQLRAERLSPTVEIPGLTAAQIERLAWLGEECGELVQAIGKVMRHGYISASPYGGPNNRAALERELGDVLAAIDLVKDAGDVRRADVHTWRSRNTPP
jgi:NTP pyrophosphatase (non-canonical NTP hydrolase)